jgi:hypothetical protein
VFNIPGFQQELNVFSFPCKAIFKAVKLGPKLCIFNKDTVSVYQLDSHMNAQSAALHLTAMV